MKRLKSRFSSFKTKWIASGRQKLLERHFRIILRHMTIIKLGNVALNLFEFLTRKTDIKSFPLYLKIEPTRFCHLRCPGCRHVVPGFSNRQMQMKLEDFKKIVDPISSTLLGISLSFYGEPMLCDDLIAMIEHASGKNVGTMFPTNLSIPLSNGQAEQLVRSGLDMMVVSLDGATSESYQSYRVGGNFNLILENVKKISDAKKKLHRSIPHIQWKFITFDHNKHETDYVRARYSEIGFDSYSIESDLAESVSKHATLYESYKKDLRDRKKGCFWLWQTMIIGWDGEVFPCCDLLQFDLGNAVTDDTKAIWKGKNYEDLRSEFAAKRNNEKMHPNCRGCIGLNDGS
jgi:radical SAM protein with 4Fe4S-binding SPASM domain